MGQEVARPSRQDGAAYGLLQATLGNAVRWFVRLEVVGTPPAGGPCVLVANHTSFLDPILLGAATRRRITFLMDAVIYRTPPLQWFYRFNRAIPVDPLGSNRDALRRARADLGAGRVLGVFPEGGISRDGLLLLGNAGAVSLALAGDAPLVPAGISGAYEALPPHRSVPSRARVRVRFGAPLLPRDLLASERPVSSSGAAAREGLATRGERAEPANDLGRKQRLQLATRRVMDAIAELCDQQSRERELEARAERRLRG